MPSTRPDRPAFLGTWWEKLIAVVVLVAAVLLVSHWWNSRGSSGPARPGMAPATVVSHGAAEDDRMELTVRYRVDGKTHEVTKPVDIESFRAHDKVVWVCYEPGDATDASIRLPQDPLCGQQ